MRRAPPVRRRDDPAGLAQLLLQRDIIEIAADSQVAVRIGADIALHQHFRAAQRPHRIIGRLHLSIGRLRQAKRAGRLEQAVVPQIIRNDLRQAAPQRGGGTGIGLGRHVPVRGERSDGDAEILPFAVIGDGAPGGKRRVHATMHLETIDGLLSGTKPPASAGGAGGLAVSCAIAGAARVIAALASKGKIRAIIGTAFYQNGRR